MLFDSYLTVYVRGDVVCNLSSIRRRFRRRGRRRSIMRETGLIW